MFKLLAACGAFVCGVWMVGKSPSLIVDICALQPLQVLKRVWKGIYFVYKVFFEALKIGFVVLMFLVSFHLYLNRVKLSKLYKMKKVVELLIKEFNKQ